MRPCEDSPHAPAASTRRRWFARLCIAVLGPLLALLALEGILRASDYGFPTTFLVPRAVDGKPLLVDNQFFGYRFFPPRLARTGQPLALDTDKPQRAFRVVILGESAAMGDPMVEYGMPRQLEILLRARLPGRQVEVINAAMTAINSHTAREIARDVARLQPDAFCVYIGNNEVLGPFGPGTVLTPLADSLPYARLHVWASRHRLPQLLQRVRAALFREDEREESWEGLALFAHSAVRRADRRMDSVYRAFASNVRDIAATGRRAGAHVVLSTVAVNLRDWPPFRSLGRLADGTPERERWQSLVSTAQEAEIQGDATRALVAYEDALNLDGSTADVHFRRARCLEALGRVSEARDAYRRARDEDALRFRTDSRQNEIVRSIAAESAAPDVTFIDAERRFDEVENVAAGASTFVDHVHFTFSGNYRLARLFADAIVSGRTDVAEAAWPDEDACRQALAYGAQDDAMLATLLSLRFQQPPYPDQADAEGRLTSWQARGRAARERAAAETLESITNRYERALSQRPRDPLLRAMYGQRLYERDQIERADEQLQVAHAAWPHRFDMASGLAVVRARSGRLEEALALISSCEPRRGHYFAELCIGTAHSLAERGAMDAALFFLRAAVNDQPRRIALRMLLAAGLERAERYDEAAREWESLVRMKPGSAAFESKLGTLYALQGNWPMAMDHLEAAVRRDPGNALAHYNLAVALLDQSRDEEAERHLIQSVGLGGGDTFTYHQLGIAAARRGKLDLARQRLTQALAREPGAVESHYALALVLLQTGDQAQARLHFVEAAARAPGRPDIANDFAWWLATREESTPEDAQLALQLARRAVGSAPHAPHALLSTLAAAQARAGDFENAVQTLDTALADGSERAEDPLRQALLTHRDLYSRHIPLTIRRMQK